MGQIKIFILILLVVLFVTSAVIPSRLDLAEARKKV